MVETVNIHALPDVAIGFATRAIAQTHSPATPPDYIRTEGFSAAGDGGAALYKQVGSEPAHEGKFSITLQNAQVIWYELAENIVTLEMFGGKADGALSGSSVTGTDNVPALEAAIDFITANPMQAPIFGAGVKIQCGVGTYAFYSTIKLQKLVTISGASGAGMGNASLGTWFVFPRDIVGIKAFSADTVDPDTGLESGSSGDGTVLESIRIQSTIGTDRTAHAISMQCRLSCRDLRIQNWSGNGYHIEAGAVSGEFAGNANNWDIQGGRVTGCHNGIFTVGGDANAGTAFHVDVSDNRQCGILDRSFLGNQYFGCHANGNSTRGWCHHNSIFYLAVRSESNFDDPSVFGTTEPGTNTSVWEVTALGNLSVTPAWELSGEFYAGGQFVSTNANSRATFVAGYSEGGFPPSWIRAPALAIGGLLGTLTSTGLQIGGEGGNSIHNVAIREAELLSAVAPNSTISEPFQAQNDGSFNTNRGSSVGFYAGFQADGTTPRKVGDVFGRGRGVGLRVWDNAGMVNVPAIEFVEVTSAAEPGADLTWTFGTAALRWLKGWFGNISLFPGASVTPANNGEVTFELTSDTTLTIKVRGSDGVVRSGAIVLA